VTPTRKIKYQSQARINEGEEVKNQSNLSPNNKMKNKTMNRHQRLHAVEGSGPDLRQKTSKQRRLRKRKRRWHRLEIDAKARTERSSLMLNGLLSRKRKSALKRRRSQKKTSQGGDNHKKTVKVPDAGVVHPLARDRLGQKQRLQNLQKQDLK
jgi:hypothetical protein